MRGLVSHVVSGTQWVPPLLAGHRTDQVTWLDGDPLGDDPVAAWRAAAAEAQAAFDQPGAATVPVHASFASFPGEEYAWQRLFDVLVHAWDLAEATGGDRRLPADLVVAVDGWLDGMEEVGREMGAIGPRVSVPADADPQARLLARCGRRP